MLTYGLTDKDREQLEYPLTYYSGFGRDPNDYIPVSYTHLTLPTNREV